MLVRSVKNTEPNARILNACSLALALVSLTSYANEKCLPFVRYIRLARVRVAVDASLITIGKIYVSLEKLANFRLWLDCVNFFGE